MAPFVCIVGAKGNMGRRYSAICWHEKIAFQGVDQGDPLPSGKNGVTHYIIATPTSTHNNILMDITLKNPDPVSVLVEKPISKEDFRTGLAPVKMSRSWGHKIYMVNNYAYYSHGVTETKGNTVYDFYNSGGDGLGWDCIQLIHLAKGSVTLSNQNPIWHCEINGTKLNRELIDHCYVKMIKDFVSDGELYGRLWGWKDIQAAHRKTLAYEKSVDRNPSPEHIH